MKSSSTASVDHVNDEGTVRLSAKITVEEMEKSECST